jgi:hypothetical protein
MRMLHLEPDFFKLDTVIHGVHGWARSEHTFTANWWTTLNDTTIDYRALSDQLKEEDPRNVIG